MEGRKEKEIWEWWTEGVKLRVTVLTAHELKGLREGNKDVVPLREAYLPVRSLYAEGSIFLKVLHVSTFMEVAVVKYNSSITVSTLILPNNEILIQTKTNVWEGRHF